MHRSRLRFVVLLLPLLVLPIGCGRDPVAESGRAADAASQRPARGGPSANPSAKGTNAGPGAADRPSGDRAGGERAPDPIPVRTGSIESATMVSIHRASTTLRAARQAPVVARAAGIVRSLRAEEGDRVSVGQLLAELEDDEARLAAEKARVDLEVAQSEFNRAEQLLREQLLSPEQHGQKQTAMAQARAARDRAELALSWTRIRAPFSGVVTRRLLDRGATVGSMQAVFELADVSKLYADVPVPEAVAASLRPGGETRLEPVASEPVAARIDRIAPAVDTGTGTVKVTVVTGASRALKPGAFVEVEVITATHSDVPTVPREALVADGTRWRLFTIENGQARAIGVVTGFENEGRVEVAPEQAGTALSPGTVVVIAGAAALSDGVPVRVISDRP
jgi:membrane fusion protein (multidrug efflux system)